MRTKTGAGTTMSRLGMADLGVATMNDMRDHAAMIASIDPTVPLVADADTGYGGGSSPPFLLRISLLTEQPRSTHGRPHNSSIHLRWGSQLSP
jgi:hypothetical protein